MEPLAVQRVVEDAFTSGHYPGDWCLRGSNEGTEPYLVEVAFRGRDNWRDLDGSFLDAAPDGYATALHFFSDEAFRFYLPAYLLADLRGELACVDPVFCLTHGLTDRSRLEFVNPRRYGVRTLFESASYRLSVFDRAQAAAIVAYLRYRQTREPIDCEDIEQSIRNYWHGRTCAPAR